MRDAIDPLSTAVEFEAPDGLPPDFELRVDGVYRRKSSGDDADFRWICSPIRVVAQIRDQHSQGWARLVEITDPDGCVHRWTMSNRHLANDGVAMREAMLEFGLRLAPDARKDLFRL